MGRPRIGVVGAGQVGAAVAFSIAKKELGDVILSDVVEGMPQGKGLDIMESRPVDRHDTGVIGTNSVTDMKGCDIVVITAGIPRKPGMSREDLLNTNVGIMKSVCGDLKKAGGSPILIVVSNPLDVMTYFALKLTGFDKKRVIGMAGVLDSARFSYFIAEKMNVSVKDISAMVLGGHGDSMVPMPRYTTIAGIPLPDLMPKAEIDKLVQRTRDGGAEIVKLLKTGSAYYAPGASVVAMVESILKDENRILPCAAYLEGEYGMRNVVVGVPVKLGDGGIKEIVQLKLNAEEAEGLKKSAAIVEENIRLVK